MQSGKSRRLARKAPIPNGAYTRYGRNDPCPCGSGLKAKRCHLRPISSINRKDRFGIGIAEDMVDFSDGPMEVVEGSVERE